MKKIINKVEIPKYKIGDVVLVKSQPYISIAVVIGAVCERNKWRYLVEGYEDLSGEITKLRYTASAEYIIKKLK